MGRAGWFVRARVGVRVRVRVRVRWYPGPARVFVESRVEEVLVGLARGYARRALLHADESLLVDDLRRGDSGGWSVTVAVVVVSGGGSGSGGGQCRWC